MPTGTKSGLRWGYKWNGQRHHIPILTVTLKQVQDDGFDNNVRISTENLNQQPTHDEVNGVFTIGIAHIFVEIVLIIAMPQNEAR